MSDFPKHGVCVYIKDSLKSCRCRDTALIPNVLPIFLPDYSLYILTIYRPPSNSPTDNAELVAFITRFCVGKEVLLVGDFNLPSIHWQSESPGDGVTARDELFLNLFDTLGLIQLVREPTFIRSGNVLDLVLSSERDRVQNVVLCPPFPHCGHVLVMFDYLFQGESTNNDPNHERPVVRDWYKGNYDSIRSALLNIDWDLELSYRDVEGTSEFIRKALFDLTCLHVPERKLQVSRPPWHKHIPRALVRHRSLAWVTYKHERSQFGRTSYQARQSLYEFNRLNIDLMTTTIHLQENYEKSLIEQRASKPKLFHAYIRKKKVSRPKVGPITVRDVLTDSPSAMAESFADAFSSVFVADDLRNPYPHQTSLGQLANINFIERDVQLVLESLKADSSMGPDYLHPYLLKTCAAELSYPVTKLFQKSLNAGLVPNLWKQSWVSPIFKKGSHFDPLNYRPISLTPVLCKSMERLVARQLFGFLDGHFILDDSQYGFRPNRSVIDQLLLTYNYITDWYDKGMVVDLIFFDFKKAFDVVHHKTLLDKLVSIGIAGNLLAWIKSFLCGRLMKVCVGGAFSSTRDVLSGVPQGSVLGPLLFLIFINHIGSQLSSKYMIFADDLKLYFHIPKSKLNNVNYIEEIQEDINTLFNTASSWGLSFAADKCVHLRYARSVQVPVVGSFYTLNGAPIQSRSFHKDLGITVESNLKFHQHIRNTVNKAGGISSNLLKSTV